jgi:sulfur transfer complex TusBCD TusB component (DsrH family)
MTSLVYLTTAAPSTLADELMLAGYQVFEALAVSEVFYLCENHDISAVIIGADVTASGVSDIKHHRVTITLQPEAKAKDVVWELSLLFPGKPVLH